MNSAIEATPLRLQMLVLDRTDERRGIARFFVLPVEPKEFGDIALVPGRERCHSFGRRPLNLYENLGEAAEKLEDWLLRKVRRADSAASSAIREGELEEDRGRCL